MRVSLVAALTAACVLLPEARASAEPEKRPVPDYDGRGKEKTTASDVLLWPPRVVVFPLWLTSEFLLRRPIGALATAAEKNRWPAKIVDFFTFGKEQQAGIIPTGYYEFGFRPSLGLYFFWNDVGFKGHELRAHAGTFGPSWVSAAFAERFRFRNERAVFAWRGEYIRRPDGLFAGLGPRSLDNNVSRFGFTRIGASTGFDINLGGLSSFSANVGVRKLSFRDDDTCCSDRTIGSVVAAGVYSLPPGFDGYTAVYQSLALALDTRKPAGSVTGLRASADFEHAGDVGDGRGRQWVRYGGHLGAFVALDTHGRHLGFIVSAAFADPLGSYDVPFTEQANLPYAATVGAGLAGLGPMRGFRAGRLIDRSSLVATVQYTWPIWIWLDGTMHFAAGNVYGAHLNDFDPKLTRFSTGIGFRTVGTPDHTFEFLIGTGTETIADGLDLNSIRLVAGATRGF